MDNTSQGGASEGTALLKLSAILEGGVSLGKETWKFVPLERDSIYEALYGDFIEMLRMCFNREIEEYQFVNLYHDDEVAGTITEYLSAKNIPHTFHSYDLERKELLPPRYAGYVTGDGVNLTFPFGIFHINPDTEDEIFYYYFGPMDRMGRRAVFVAYRKEESLNRLIRGIREFRMERIKNNRLMIFDGEEIPLEEVCYEDVILPDDLYRGIRLSIESFLKGKEMYRRLNLPYRRGILLAGEPGNGKTLLCKAIAWESGLPFIVCSMQHTLTDLDIDEAFEKARAMSPAIICFEDLDSLKRTSVALSYFLNKIDGMDSVEGVLILATTNRPEEIDVALSNRPSRFDSVFRIPRPDGDCRYRMLKRYFRDTVGEEVLKRTVKATSGFSMAYLKELYLLSVMYAINRGRETPTEEEINGAVEVLKRQMVYARKPVEEDRSIGFDIDELFR